jgi:hypothetical protein
MLLSKTIKAKPRLPERHRKKFAYYIAQDEKGKIYSTRTMRTLAKAVNKTRKPGDYCYSQHLYRVASGHQLSPHKGIVVRRLDSEEDYDCWKNEWLSDGEEINSELF